MGGKLLGQLCPNRVTGYLSAPGTKRSKNNQIVLLCLAAACLALFSVQFGISNLWLRIASVPWGERHKKLIKSENIWVGRAPQGSWSPTPGSPKDQPKIKKKIRPCLRAVSKRFLTSSSSVWCPRPWAACASAQHLRVQNLPPAPSLTPPKMYAICRSKHVSKLNPFTNEVIMMQCLAEECSVIAPVANKSIRRSAAGS